MRREVAGTVIISMVTAMAIAGTGPAAASAPHRSFSADSYWNTQLPAGAPLHPDSARIVDFLRRDNATDYVLLSGTDPGGEWGQPVYWATAGDPGYDVRSSMYDVPPEFADLRIPAGARPDPTSDAEMTVYDLERGYVAGLWLAEYDDRTDTWTAGGGEIFYLGSNGLDGRLPESDEPRNGGAHRGLPPSTYAIRYDEIQAGVIDHVLKIGVNNVRHNSHVFPMTGDEPGTTDPAAPAEGARIRIKPTVHLPSLGLSGPALTVAAALQRYGAIIGDQTGGPVELKTENTVAEGRGQLWSGVLTSSALRSIPLSAYEVVEYGYRPPPGSVFVPAPAETPRIEVLSPRKKKVRAGRRVRIAWEASGDGQEVEVRYRTKRKRPKLITTRPSSDGRYRWRTPKRLQGERLRIMLSLSSGAGGGAAGQSRWFRAT